MKGFVCFVLLCISLFFKVDAQSFLRAYGNEDNNYYYWYKYSSTGDCFYAFGIATDIPFVTKFDRNGNIIWNRYYQQGHSPADIEELPVLGQESPDILVCFSKFGTFRDIHVMRIDSDNGEVVWSYEYIPQTTVRFPHLVISSDNKIIISAINLGNSGMYYAKLELDGSVIWTKRYTSSSGSTFASSGNMIRDYNGGVLNSFQRGNTSGLFSLDANGNLGILQQSNIFHIFRDLALAKDGYLIATILDWDARGRDHGVTKLDLNYNVKWSKRVNPSMATTSNCNACGLPGVGEAPNGDVFYVQDSYLPGYLAFSFLRFNENGQLLKSRSFKNADVSLQSLESVGSGYFSVIGATSRGDLCIPGSENGLLGVFTEDIEICETIDINPTVQDIPLVFSALPPAAVNVADHPVTRNAYSTFSREVAFSQTNFCEDQEDFIDLGPDVAFCGDTTIILNVGSGYNSYQWSTGESGQSISVDASGTYSVTVSTVCGSTLRDTISITIGDALVFSIDPVICQGQTFLVGSSAYSVSGQYVDTLLSSTGCDSIISTNLTVLQDAIVTALTDTICQGEVFSVGNSNFSTSGNYSILLSSTSGCDSTVNLNLTVLPGKTANQSATICEGESYSIGNQSFNSEGIFTIVIPSSNGCDSTITLNLTVLSAPSRTIGAVICQGQTFTLGNQQFSETGNYTVPVPAASGCDSIITLELRVEVPAEQVLNPVICAGEQFQVGNQIFTEEGQYVVILSDSKGCDSILRINLKVFLPSDDELQVTICDGQSYTVGSNTYNTSGTYTDSLLNIAGCDSIITTILSVAERYEQQEEATICRGETFLWNGQTISVAGEYQAALSSVAGCDSIVTLQLTVSDLPIINAVASADYIYRGEQVILTATPSNNNLSYSWSPPEFILNPNESMAQALPIQDTWFIISVRDNESDCLGSDSVFVQVFDDCSISLPTAFSPNGDGINDCYRVLGRPGYTNFNLSIFNRWSELVYRSDSPDSCWDGSFEGAPAPMDNYIVHIAYTCNEDKSVSKSSVLLLVR
jgi:gliding motility-associated-like protein